MFDAGGRVDSREAESLIGWWREAGVDTLVQEAPRDWLERTLKTGLQEEE